MPLLGLRSVRSSKRSASTPSPTPWMSTSPLNGNATPSAPNDVRNAPPGATAYARYRRPTNRGSESFELIYWFGDNSTIARVGVLSGGEA